MTRTHCDSSEHFVGLPFSNNPSVAISSQMMGNLVYKRSSVLEDTLTLHFPQCPFLRFEECWLTLLSSHFFPVGGAHTQEGRVGRFSDRYHLLHPGVSWHMAGSYKPKPGSEFSGREKVAPESYAAFYLSRGTYPRDYNPSPTA